MPTYNTSHFNKAIYYFKTALLAQSFSSSQHYLEEMFRSLALVKFSKDEQYTIDKFQDFFVEIFQFQVISSSPHWDLCGELYNYIAPLMDKYSSHEKKFRSKVQRENLGLFLDFIE